MSLNRISAWSLAALLGAFAPLAQAQQESSEWRQTVFLYGMGAAIDGDAQVGPLQVPVDVGLSDFFDALKFGAMAAYRIENDAWSFGGDITYMNLGWSETTQQGWASLGLDVEQWTAMATVGRRVAPHLEALISVPLQLNYDQDIGVELRLGERAVVGTGQRQRLETDTVRYPVGKLRRRRALLGR